MGNFSFEETALPGVVLVVPRVFGDDRGYFMETYSEREFAAAGIPAAFVQDNESKSSRGVLRGLHFQRENTQGKLVRVFSGRVYDVAVDLRPNSPAFGRWVGMELNGENRRQLYVPPGFGHGFLVLSDEAVFNYKCTDFYNPAAEGGVLWNDAAIGVAWPDPGAPVQLSGKDAALPGLRGQDFQFFERWYGA